MADTETSSSRPGPPELLLALIVALVTGLLLCMLVGGRWAQFLFGLFSMALPSALMALGVPRRGLRGRVGAVLVVLALVLVGGFLAMVALAGQGVQRMVEGPWLAGLPLAAAIFLATVWLLPLVLISLAYGWTFRDHGVGDEELRRLRSLVRLRDAGTDAGREGE